MYVDNQVVTRHILKCPIVKTAKVEIQKATSLFEANSA